MSSSALPSCITPRTRTLVPSSRIFSPRGRQVYFYSVRFIRLNMTCGYSPGDIFPILRDDFPTLLRVPRVSCIFFSLLSLAASRFVSTSTAVPPPDRSKIRMILRKIIARIVSGGEFMAGMPTSAVFSSARRSWLDFRN